MTSPHRPVELVLMGGAVGLKQAGIDEDTFIAAAPLAACRLCGAVYQTDYHRRLYHERLEGIENLKLVGLVLDLGTIWREKHTNENHTVEEVEAFSKTGWAFTPEAANVLAPYGIIPLGNMTQEIADAMFEADRKPDLTYLEGGE